MGHIATKFSGLRVLIAEDYEINQEVIQDILELMECEVSIANNGAEAVEIQAQNAHDLIFMDIQMPIKDGYQATKEIRANEREGEHVIIIALTANAMSGDREKCLAANMDDYIPKPIEAHTIESALSKHFPSRATTPA